MEFVVASFEDKPENVRDEGGEHAAVVPDR
jgi:hypothetical protein